MKAYDVVREISFTWAGFMFFELFKYNQQFNVTFIFVFQGYKKHAQIGKNDKTFNVTGL